MANASTPQALHSLLQLLLDRVTGTKFDRHLADDLRTTATRPARSA